MVSLSRGLHSTMAIFGPYLRERIDEGYRRLARELHKQPLPLLPLPTGSEGHTPLRSHPAVANHHARQPGCQAGPTERAPTAVGAPTRVTGDPPDGPRAPYASGAVRAAVRPHLRGAAGTGGHPLPRVPQDGPE